MNVPGELIAGLLGGVVGYLIKHALDLRFRRQTELLIRQREVYDQLVSSLGVFLSGRQASPDDQQRFLDTYASLWLWAPDAVIRPLNEFLKLNVKTTQRGQKIPQEQARGTYAKCVLEMRKDLGFSGTKLTEDDFRFVSFGP